MFKDLKWSVQCWTANFVVETILHLSNFVVLGGLEHVELWLDSRRFFIGLGEIIIYCLTKWLNGWLNSIFEPSEWLIYEILVFFIVILYLFLILWGLHQKIIDYLVDSAHFISKLFGISFLVFWVNFDLHKFVLFHVYVLLDVDPKFNWVVEYFFVRFKLFKTILVFELFINFFYGLSVSICLDVCLFK